MKTKLLDTPSRRIPIAVAVVTLLIVLGAGIYLFLRTPAMPPANAPKIIAAASAYAHALRQAHSPVPDSVPLQVLIDKGLLQPADVGPFQGMDAKIQLTARANVRDYVLMRVHLPDGTDLILLANGSAQQTAKK